MAQKVLIAGGTGLVGRRLVSTLVDLGYHIHVLTRSRRADKPNVSYFTWDFSTMSIQSEAVQVDHIINLTGAGIADARWTEKRKKVLVESRTKAAQLILKGIQSAGNKPKSYISASAVGYYGNRGEELLDENSNPGTGFMADCCIAWEKAALELEPMVERLIINRIGIVLSKKGGALPKILMTKPVYSYFGNGNQYYPWVHIDDLCQMFIKGIKDNMLNGIYNTVAPLPLKNKEFTKQIKNVLGGIALVPTPVFALRLAMGEMADVILNSNRVIPSRLVDYGFNWKFPSLQEAIEDIQVNNI